MSWIHRFNRMLARGTAAQTPDSAPAAPSPPPARQLAPPSAPQLAPPSAPPSAQSHDLVPATPAPRPARKPASPKEASKRPLSPHLASRAAAVKAVAEAMRKAHNQAEAAANARALLARMGVKVPAPQPPAPLLSGDRKALIAEAMNHWARGHAIYQKLDPNLKERVRQLAERMAPK